MRVHPPACPDGGRSCRGPSPGSGGRDCPHSAVLTVASLPWAGPAQPYFLITSLAGPWEPPRQAGAQGSVGSQTRGSRGGSGGHGWKRGSRVEAGVTGAWWRREAAGPGLQLAGEQVRMQRD